MMGKQFAGKSRDDSDSMDSYADEYYTTESAYVSPYGTAGWKPRMLSAKRDFPKAFDEVTAHEHSSVSKDKLQNISDIGFGVPQLPKRQKVAVVSDFPVRMTGNNKEYNSEECPTDSKTVHLPYVDAKVVSDDLVPFKLDTTSSGGIINREMPSSESAYLSPYGTAGWKPRMLSAKRDFPKAFDEVTAHEHSSVSKDKLQNISDIGFGVPQLPKRRKVAVVRDFPVRMTGNYKEYKCPVESEEGPTDSKTVHLPYVDDKVVICDDLVPFKLDTTSSGGSINREMLSSDYEKTDMDQLIKPLKRMINLPYEGARVVSDDLVCESSGGSINREMLSSDYEDKDMDQLIKPRKRMINLPYEGARVVSDDLVCESSGTSINREMLSSDYENTDVDELNHIEEEKLDLPYEGAKVLSEDLDSGSGGTSNNREMLSLDEDTDYIEEEERYEDGRTSNVKKVQAEEDTLGPYTVLKIHGASVKDIRWNLSEGQGQIQLSIDNLQNYGISITSGKESGIHIKRTTSNHTDTRKQLHSHKRRVSVVRDFPPGCGPDAAPFTDEELEGICNL